MPVFYSPVPENVRVGLAYVGTSVLTNNRTADSKDQEEHSDKTKEMIIDPRTREKEPHRPLFIHETEVERVKTFKFLGTHISEDLTWSHNTQQIMKKSQRRLYFLRRLRKFGMSTTILSCFYRCTMESVLTASITVWYGNCTTRDRKALQRVIKTSQNIVGAALPSLQDIYKTRVLRRTHNLIKDSTHPQHSLFTLLPSGRRYRSLKSRTTRLANSFYPQAIRLLNEALTHATRNTHTLIALYLFVLFICINVSSVFVA
ncbi:transmembrane protein 17A isoform X2 [Dunckerocampus dactyliophorus]|uniref:transmembrane protein 17A isoform X2 n=1 Tax=Dunckerocampus dactyliophorus TaxID=161453 RepID=UPI002406F6B3|nr:transmembrane protein 17A isoform X2 [Dunckerocampus dactyliophorus]